MHFPRVEALPLTSGKTFINTINLGVYICFYRPKPADHETTLVLFTRLVGALFRLRAVGGGRTADSDVIVYAAIPVYKGRARPVGMVLSGAVNCVHVEEYR